MIFQKGIFFIYLFATVNYSFGVTLQFRKEAKNIKMYQYYLFVDIYLVLGKYLIFFPTMLKMYITVENFTETYTLPYSNAKAEPPGTCHNISSSQTSCC